MDKTGLADYNNTNLQINLFLDHRYQIDILTSIYQKIYIKLTYENKKLKHCNRK